MERKWPVGGTYILEGVEGRTGQNMERKWPVGGTYILGRADVGIG